MSLYEQYKRYKAGKFTTSLNKTTLNLFVEDFTESQMFAISKYAFKNELLSAVLITFSFIIGAIWGISQVV